MCAHNIMEMINILKQELFFVDVIDYVYLLVIKQL